MAGCGMTGCVAGTNGVGMKGLGAGTVAAGVKGLGAGMEALNGAGIIGCTDGAGCFANWGATGC